MVMKTVGKFALSSILGLLAFCLMVFLPAGTLHYWQGWVFLAVFLLATWIPSFYLMRTNPAALDRRMHAGPAQETRPVQKVISFIAFLSLVAIVVVSALDHRFGWSTVPTSMSVLGAVLVAIGLTATMLVVIQNGYAAANITVESGQTLVSTGMYGLVRHPMYAGTVIIMIGIPPALGSYWGLLILIPVLVVLALRIRDEEDMLEHELTGYSAYEQQVHYRLVPYVW
jgi:protein-S-isoprenylcysteine O-methyltransferase Ste14